MSYIPGFFEKLYLAFKTWMLATQWLRALKLIFALVIAAMLIFVVSGNIIESTSMFTISLIPAPEEIQTADGKAPPQISMCETADFANPTTVLDAGGMENMTNISQYWLPAGLGETDGSHNGENYLAYTFYVTNSGGSPGVLCSRINLDSALLGAEAAIRVRLYRNGIPETFALVGEDGLPEYGTTPFESDEVVMSDELLDFNPGDIIKYTIVMWLEGDDPQCLDNIRGGSVKMSMDFEVRGVEAP